MSNYLLRYKGKYRILPTLEEDTHDFPRRWNGVIDDSDIYITCQYGNKIFCYGQYKGSRTVWLEAYIPSIGRGRNIKSELDRLHVEYKKYTETDKEVLFQFQAKDIESVANLLKAKTLGPVSARLVLRIFQSLISKYPLAKLNDIKKLRPLSKRVTFLSFIKLQRPSWSLNFNGSIGKMTVYLIINQI